MPNREEHAVVGTAIGVVASALVLSQREVAPEYQIATLGAGALGGLLGGFLPDLVEPATSPNHRSTAHSFVAAGALMASAVRVWRAEFSHTPARAEGPGSGEHLRVVGEPAESPWRVVLVGFSIAVIAAYVSHLAMDARTPRGLPIVA